MTTTKNPQSNNQTTDSYHARTQIPFDSIGEPGAYVCNWSGHLLRVPEDGFTPGRSPMLNLVAHETLFVTKISDNPYITLTKARLLASNFDMNVNW